MLTDTACKNTAFPGRQDAGAARRQWRPLPRCGT